MLNPLKTFLHPEMFPFGSDVDEVYRLPQGQFYKRFKRLKFANYCKTLFVLEQFQGCLFVPTVFRSTPDLELYLSDCGNLLTVNSLPPDWEAQLNAAKAAQQARHILIRDWGLWELNPFVLNNLCVRHGTIAFVDLGDATAAGPAEIEAYFAKKIRAIKYVQVYGAYYLPFHFSRRFVIMVYRKLRWGSTWVFLGLCYMVYHLWTEDVLHCHDPYGNWTDRWLPGGP